MRWIELPEFSVDDDGAGSHGVHMVRGAWIDQPGIQRAHVARFEPGSLLARHPTKLWQVFAVIEGSGWVSGGDGEHELIDEGQAVIWEPGESHESGTEHGMLVLIVASDSEELGRPRP